MRGGRNTQGLPSAISGLANGSNIQAGDVPVGVVDAGGGRLSLVHKGAAGTEWRVGEVSNGPAYLRARYRTPQDQGFIGWSMPPECCPVGSALVTAGRLYFVTFGLAEATPITRIHMHVQSAGGTLTAGQCFAGIAQGGVLLGTTADQSGQWNSVGTKIMSISGGPVMAAAGDIDVVMFFNGTTGPSFASAASLGGAVQAGMANGAIVRGGVTSDTGRTTSMPATIGTKTLNTIFLAALS